MIDSLEGEALPVLTCLEQSKRTDFDALVSRLNTQYGSEDLMQLNRYKFHNYNQNIWESLQSMANQICLVSQSVFSDSTFEFRNKQTCQKFVETIRNNESKKDVTHASINSVPLRS